MLYFLSLLPLLGLLLGLSMNSTSFLLLKSCRSQYQLKASNEKFQHKGLFLFVFSVFLFLVFVNFAGLVPYKFGLSTVLYFSLGISLVFWFGLNLSKGVYNTVSYVGHLVPEGSPAPLIPLLVFMELVSKLMRSATLCLRLTINMMTGHIFITLMSIGLMSLFFNSGFFFFALVSLFQVGYLFFEVFVCVLQGFVFSLLLLQYCKEHPLS